MNHLDSWRLRNIVSFEDQTFKIPKGLSVIHGINRTTKNSLNGNGAGKSLLTSQVGEIIYDVPMVGEKQDRITTGQRDLNFVSYNGEKIQLHRKGKKLTATVNGEPKTFRTQKEAGKWLRSVFPINEEEFNSYVYLDGRVPHPLVMGSSTERKRFFTKFFGLDKIDAERKLFNAELDKLAKVRAAHKELNNTYLEAQKDLLDPKAIKSLKIKYRELKARNEELTAKTAKYNEILPVMLFADSAKDQIKALVNVCGGEVSDEAFEEAEKSLAYENKQYTKNLADAEAWEDYQKDTARYQKAFGKLSKPALRYLQFGKTLKDLEEVRSKYSKVKARMSDVKAKLEDLADDLKKPKTVEQPAKEPWVYREVVSTLKHKIEHAVKFKKGTCPSCGQSVKVESVNDLKDKLANAERKLKQAEAYEGFLEDSKVYENARKLTKELTQELEALKEKRAKYKPMLEIYDELSALPKRPKKFEGKKLELVVMRKIGEELTQKRMLLEFCKPHIDTIVKFMNLSEKDIERASKADRLMAKVAKVNEEISDIRAKLELQATVGKRLESMKARLEELAAKLADEPALRALVNGYSDKQMKKMAIQAISEHLMATVNRYARMVFPEDFRFEFQWEANKVGIIVHRKLNKKIVPSDVRRLSGAESKFFTIVLALSLLAYVPKRKRCNVMFMDEPTANMSDENIKTFQEFLPVVNSLIPSIVIITPKNDRYENSQPFTVVKVHGKSKVVKGHPDEVSKNYDESQHLTSTSTNKKAKAKK